MGREKQWGEASHFERELELQFGQLIPLNAVQDASAFPVCVLLQLSFFLLLSYPSYILS
jgi:hypothetical protein